MRIKCCQTLLVAMVVLMCLFLFADIALAAPPDPYANDPGDSNPVPSSGFQGWEIAEIQVPDPTATNTSSVAQGDVKFINYWYPVGSWGNDPSDGRMALYIDYFDSGQVAMDLQTAEWLSGINIAYNAKEGYSDINAGAYMLYNLTASNFVQNNPTWIWVPSPPSGKGNGNTTQIPSNLGSDPNNPNPQYLSSADSDASRYNVKYYYTNNYWLFQPSNGIYQGNGQSPGWFGDYQIYPPDMEIRVDAGNANQPVAAGTKVTGSFVVLNHSAYTWQNVQATLYLADANGNILSTIATIPNLSITSQSSYSGNFTWTMPNQPNGVEIVGAVDETVGSNTTQLTHLQITSPAGMSTYQDYDWSNNLSIIPVPLASGGSGNTPVLVVQPPTATVQVGGQQQFRALYYPNGTGGSSQDVTTSASWYSGNTGVATVVVTGSSGGLATGVAQGYGAR